MADDFDQIFEEARRLTTNTTTAYDDLTHPSLSSEEGDGPILPPVEPTEEELARFIQELPESPDHSPRNLGALIGAAGATAPKAFSRLLEDFDLAGSKPAPSRIIQEDEDCQLSEIEIEMDRHLEKVLDRKYMAPAPKAGYYTHNPVQDHPELHTIYRTFKGMLHLDIPITSISLGVGRTLLVKYEGTEIHLLDEQKQLDYSLERTEKGMDVLIWVANQHGRVGYIYNGWTYRKQV